MKGVDSRHQGGDVKEIAKELGLSVRHHGLDFVTEQGKSRGGAHLHGVDAPKPDDRSEDQGHRCEPSPQTGGDDSTQKQGGCGMSPELGAGGQKIHLSDPSSPPPHQSPLPIPIPHQLGNINQTDAGDEPVKSVKGGQGFDSMQGEVFSEGFVLMPAEAEDDVSQDHQTADPIETPDDLPSVRRIVQPMLGFLFLFFCLAHDAVGFIRKFPPSGAAVRIGRKERSNRSRSRPRNNTGHGGLPDSLFLLRLLGPEEGGHRHGKKINVEQRTDQQDHHHPQGIAIQGSEGEVPLADETAERRQTDHAEGSDHERSHGEGHLPAQTPKLADVFLARGHEDRPGAKRTR